VSDVRHRFHIDAIRLGECVLKQTQARPFNHERFYLNLITKASRIGQSFPSFPVEPANVLASRDIAGVQFSRNLAARGELYLWVLILLWHSIVQRRQLSIMSS
jgi:hypothetical protein